MKKMGKKALRARVEQLEEYIGDVGGVLPPWPEIEGGPGCIPVPGLAGRVDVLEEQVARLVENAGRTANLVARIDGQDNVLRRHNKAIKELAGPPED